MQNEILNWFVEFRAQMRSTSDVMSSSYILKVSLIHFQYHMCHSSNSKIIAIEGNICHFVRMRIGKCMGDGLSIIIIITTRNIMVRVLVNNLRVEGDEIG